MTMTAYTTGDRVGTSPAGTLALARRQCLAAAGRRAGTA